MFTKPLHFLLLSRSAPSYPRSLERNRPNPLVYRTRTIIFHSVGTIRYQGIEVSWGEGGEQQWTLRAFYRVSITKRVKWPLRTATGSMVGVSCSSLHVIDTWQTSLCHLLYNRYHLTRIVQQVLEEAMKGSMQTAKENS